ncbi:glycosyltransferase family 2 protein [Rubrolithibacter danxiaensis]|uniref:glycosyltransferase family 2 protein n=1 Tax=Rubrolithibacter danxiaensis TaxID=3390805 RepID=UPI003BF92367
MAIGLLVIDLMFERKKISTSLIISTYNWPKALDLCLLSVLNQQVLPDEVIIADDGSGDETKALIEKHKKNFPVPLIHVWQPDEGFQLAKIRNKAIAASTKDYIIQIDGDLILHSKFISDHLSFANPGYFVTGSRVMIDKELSGKLLQECSIKLNIFTKGLFNISNGFRISIVRNYLAERYRINDIYFMRGCNMAFWRKDLIKVNGYNEEFAGWGREDNEVAARLINAGIKKRVLKFGGVVFHIFHVVNERMILEKNNILLLKAIKEKKVECLQGLKQYL